MWPTETNRGEKFVGRIIFVTHFMITMCLLIVLEFIYMYQSVESHYNEFVKTVGTTSYHIFCAIGIIHWFVVRERSAEILNILNRESFKTFIVNKTDYDICKKTQTRAAMLIYLFSVPALCSLSFSYISALAFPTETYEATTNSTKTLWMKPYNSYSFLNVEKRKNFVLDLVFQLYSIAYTTLCFLCKYDSICTKYKMAPLPHFTDIII